MNKRERDRGSALFWLVMGIGICYGSARLSLGVLHKPGPGFFSFLAGSVLIILSFFLFLQSFKRLSKEEEEKVNKAFGSNPQRGLKMAYALIALIIYAIGMNYLGFFFSTPLFLGFLLKGIGSQRWSMVLAVSILGTVISYGIFEYWLGVPFPRGIWGF